MFCDEVQDSAVENFRLFPIRRVTGFGYDDGFGALDPGGEQAEQRRWSVHVRPAGQEESGYCDRLEQPKGHPVLHRLCWWGWCLRPTRRLQLEPAARAARIGGAVGRSQLT